MIVHYLCECCSNITCREERLAYANTLETTEIRQDVTCVYCLRLIERMDLEYE